ncbi:MFS transporter [Streptomyces sp. KR55]|uniref:MFS transporter n=1 Tax=Streptomyces sp. KR55 TaxID=3457425 RepID=UPI003FD04B26
MTLADVVPGTAAQERSRALRRVVLSSFLGSTIEFYDFILYATASSLVFGPVFFSGLGPAVATVASYATFAIGYLSRPLGGIVFGHFGDRIGRKRMLLLSMTVMGVASTLIGLVPAVPVWGAVALIVLRAAQGIAVGGEWGGAALMSLEHAGPQRRGLASSFTNAGAPAGAALGTIALALAGLLPREDFLSWGWRIPFLLSAALLVVGLFVRRRVEESPVFQEAMAKADEQKAPSAKEPIPLLRILRRPRNLLTAGLVCMAGFAIQALFSTFGMTYAVQHGITEGQALAAFAIAEVVAIPVILGAAHLSDLHGRKPVMLAGIIAMAVLAWPVFALLRSGSFPLVVAAFLLSMSLCQSLTFGPLPAFTAEQFGTRARYTGASLGYQLASLLGAGFTPMIVASLVAAAHGGVGSTVGYLTALCAISAVVLIAFVRETRDNDLAADPQA